MCVYVCVCMCVWWLQLLVSEKTQNVRRLEAQRNELNAKGEKSEEERGREGGREGEGGGEGEGVGGGREGGREGESE